ncbi:hypothetical protein B0H11DRAFT_2302907 [Mycena galericulata]|nr:hypothetical protein B0H11DRAFT_2302907 [Mycena galericulata]
MCMASLTATKSVNAPVAQFGDITHVAQTTLVDIVRRNVTLDCLTYHSLIVAVFLPIVECGSTEPECALPRSYTPEELLQLAQSPLAKQLVAVMYEPVRSFSEIAISRRRQRSRKYFARTPTSKVPAIVAVPAASTPTHGLPSRGAVNRRHASPKNANGPGWRCQL